MKKIIYNLTALFVLVTVSLMCSCTNDDIETAEYTQVRFFANLPSEVVTRGYGEANQINKLIVGVFDEEQNETGRYSFDVTGTSFEVIVPLVKDRKYNLVFWAQNSECEAYDTSDLKQIKMTPDSEVTTFDDAERYDAFYSIQKQFYIENDIKEYSVTLYRPLAQINIGKTGETYPSTIVLNKVPNILNTFTGEMEGDNSFTWNFDDATVQTFDIDGVQYNRLALLYVFASPFGQKVNGELTLNDTINSRTKTFNLSEIDIQLNKKTNIGGSFELPALQGNL